MKSLHDAWTLYRERLPALVLSDPRAGIEIERAFFAGAEFAIDAVQDLNVAGLTMPFALADQLQKFSSEVHAARYQRPRLKV